MLATVLMGLLLISGDDIAGAEEVRAGDRAAPPEKDGGPILRWKPPPIPPVPPPNDHGLLWEAGWI